LGLKGGGGKRKAAVKPLGEPAGVSVFSATPAEENVASGCFRGKGWSALCRERTGRLEKKRGKSLVHPGAGLNGLPLSWGDDWAAERGSGKEDYQNEEKSVERRVALVLHGVEIFFQKVRAKGEKAKGTGIGSSEAHPYKQIGGLVSL